MSGPVKTSTAHDEPRVVHQPEHDRFAIYLGDTLAGVAVYRDEQGRRVFTHTEVAEAFAGRGLAGRLAAFALDETRSDGLSVVPICSFIAAYIERHPTYQDLVESP
jgi:predicted GNAT family acetyltransferase